MAFRFRKSVKLGPLRVNLSKSGVGYSVGNKFYRVTKKANGGMRTTATLPGTGISNVKDYSKDQVKEAAQMPSTSNKKEKAPAIIGGAIALLLLIGAVAGSGDDSSKDEDATPSTRQEQTVKPSTSTKTTTTTKTDTPAPSTSAETKTETTTPSTPTEPAAPATQPSTKTETTAQASQSTTQNERKVYRTKTGKRYHYDSHCNGGDYYEVTLSDAQNAGLTPCQKCAGG